MDEQPIEKIIRIAIQMRECSDYLTPRQVEYLSNKIVEEADKIWERK